MLQCASRYATHPSSRINSPTNHSAGSRDQNGSRPAGRAARQRPADFKRRFGESRLLFCWAFSRSVRANDWRNRKQTHEKASPGCSGEPSPSFHAFSHRHCLREWILFTRSFHACLQEAISSRSVTLPVASGVFPSRQRGQPWSRLSTTSRRLIFLALQSHQSTKHSNDG